MIIIIITLKKECFSFTFFAYVSKNNIKSWIYLSNGQVDKIGYK